MNRLILFFSLLFFLPGWAAGQDWAPIGAKWHYYGFDFYTDCNYGYSTMDSVRDTVVQGKTARVLQITSFGEDNMPEREEIMYGDADRIYHYLPEADSFYVLYDFSAVAGDTLFIRTTPFQDYYGRFGLVSQFILLVDSTSSMIIDGDTLRVQYVHALEPDSVIANFTWGGQRILTEKIGAGLMFGLPTVLPLAGCWGGLRCYADETLSVSFASQACDYLTSLDAEWGNPDLIRLWPNPARTYLQVAYCPVGKPLSHPRIVIWNPAGQVVLEQEISRPVACLETELSLEGLPAGLYRLALYDDKGLLGSGNVVVE